MKYYTLHISDSGAIENFEQKIISGKATTVCEMYDDREFNSLNDMLHSTKDYIMNAKTYSLFEQSKIIPYDIRPVILKRTERMLGLIKIKKSYEYKHLKIHKPKDLFCYDWINFGESEINILRDKDKVGELVSHEELLKHIDENHKISSKINQIYSLTISDYEKKQQTKDLKAFSFETKTIVFNKKFDSSIDLFEIPYYSWGTYVSERFKQLMQDNGITDIAFAETKEELGKVWKPYFPNIRFEVTTEENLNL